jgi:hypothetical protein
VNTMLTWFYGSVYSLELPRNVDHGFSILYTRLKTRLAFQWVYSRTFSHLDSSVYGFGIRSQNSQNCMDLDFCG